MKKIKYILRLIGLIIFMLLASAGAGLTGHFLPTTRERYQDKKITREQVDKKEDESESEDENKKI